MLDERAETWPIVRLARPGVLDAERLMRIPRRHVVAAGGMRVVVGHHRAQDGNLVEMPGSPRHQLADEDAGDIGLNRPQIAAHLGDGIGLRIPRLMLRRAAQEAHDDARLRASHLPSPLGEVLRAPARAASRSGNVRPARPRLPMRSQSRRVMPSHSGMPWSCRFNIDGPPSGMGG